MSAKESLKLMGGLLRVIMYPKPSVTADVAKGNMIIASQKDVILLLPDERKLLASSPRLMEINMAAMANPMEFFTAEIGSTKKTESV